MFGSNCAVLTMATRDQVTGGTGSVTLTGWNATTGEPVQQMADLDYFTCLLLSLFCHYIFMCV